jgi:hypothetical protein
MGSIGENHRTLDIDERIDDKDAGIVRRRLQNLKYGKE